MRGLNSINTIKRIYEKINFTYCRVPQSIVNTELVLAGIATYTDIETPKFRTGLNIGRTGLNTGRIGLFRKISASIKKKKKKVFFFFKVL